MSLSLRFRLSLSRVSPCPCLSPCVCVSNGAMDSALAVNSGIVTNGRITIGGGKAPCLASHPVSSNQCLQLLTVKSLDLQLDSGFHLRRDEAASCIQPWSRTEQTGDSWKAMCEVSFSSSSVSNLVTSRRNLACSILMGPMAFLLLHNRPALASSYRDYIDRLDGYSFSYPSGWIQVRGAGADVFFRDPVNLDENVVVDFSSPSSSRYKSVEDLGTPQQAAEKVLKQKLTEFMSTRLGVRRESNIVSAGSRIGGDGRLYYDIEVDVKSYANTNELAVMPMDRVVKLEWSRRYLSTLGVENNRLYELRLQAPEKVLAQEGTGLRQIMNSFQLQKLGV